MRNQARENGENGKVERKNRNIGKATVRQSQEEENGRNRKPSSRKSSGHGRKKVKARRTIRKVRTRSKHLRNSCGSESGKGERKRTVVLSTRTVKGCMRNQAKGNGENIGSESGR